MHPIPPFYNLAHCPPPLLCAACYHFRNLTNMVTHNLL
nr:MAG TPA: hypothetical protein [Bacteriophage sp.]